MRKSSRHQRETSIDGFFRDLYLANYDLCSTVCGLCFTKGSELLQLKPIMFNKQYLYLTRQKGLHICYSLSAKLLSHNSDVSHPRVVYRAKYLARKF